MESLKSHNPATGDVVGEVAVTPVEDIPGIVGRARAAQPAWDALGLQGRAELLRKAIRVFDERADRKSTRLNSSH